jgi:hypothetical protein
MKYEITADEVHRAKVPHELFLANLIGNHILWFVAALGVSGSFWQPLALVPTISLATLFYTLWRANQAKRTDPWFVMCHWQLCAQRSRVFLLTFAIFGLVSLLGWVGYTHFGMKDVAVKAMIGGMGVLPVMVSVLVLIILESDALHQAAQQRLPKGISERFPNPEAVVQGE